MKMVDNEIEVGKTFKCYDGCVNLSKEYEVTVKEIIPFENADENLLYHWEISKQCWKSSYAETTDYFLICDSTEWPEEYPVAIFARTNPSDGNDRVGWLGLGNLVLDEENSYTGCWGDGILITKLYASTYPGVRECLDLVEEDRIKYE